MGKDTVVVGVATPGVRTIQRTRHKLAEAEWLALCVPEKDGSDIVVLKGRDGRKLRSFGAGHHHITCFVAVRSGRSLRALTLPPTVTLTHSCAAGPGSDRGLCVHRRQARRGEGVELQDGR